MTPFWIKFETGAPGCVEAQTLDEAKAIAEQITGRKATGGDCLPYPASPRLNTHSYGGHGPCPSFCYTPAECAGRSSCPKRRACDD